MKTCLLMILIFTLIFVGAGCSTVPERPTTPDHGILGEQVPAPWGWDDYLKRGGS